jgi:hypothetical protein
MYPVIRFFQCVPAGDPVFDTCILLLQFHSSGQATPGHSGVLQGVIIRSMIRERQFLEKKFQRPTSEKQLH